MEYSGINYSLPQVTLLQETGIGTSEVAARTCYDSFDSSENQSIRNFGHCADNDFIEQDEIDSINSIEHSDLLDELAWTYFHHSILEHANLTYLIRGTSRGVLQESARHRLQSISVRSTRYTMSSVINAFVASLYVEHSIQFFASKIKELDLFVIIDNDYINLEIESMFNKLLLQYNKIGKEEFIKISIAKSSLLILNEFDDVYEMYEKLQSGKKKRNVGDAFKHLVTDNWKVDMVVTMNVRALKNFFTLRDSGAAYFQIRNLAKAMKEVTPSKYLDLIIKKESK